MIKRDCINFKHHGMWNEDCCRFCKAGRCDERKQNYSLASERKWSLRIPMIKVLITSGGQYYWDF